LIIRPSSFRQKELPASGILFPAHYLISILGATLGLCRAVQADPTFLFTAKTERRAGIIRQTDFLLLILTPQFKT
jgi:hypothetical protein